MNACEALVVEAIKSNCPRVNSTVLWSLGISGSAARCKNKAMGELMKKVAACIGVLSHSAVNNDMLRNSRSWRRTSNVYTSSSGETTRVDLYFEYCICIVFVHLELSGTRLCCSCNAVNIIIFLYSVFLFQSLVIKFQILVFCTFRCYMVLEIETFRVQIRHVSATFITVLNNASVWCPFGLVRFPSHEEIFLNIKYKLTPPPLPPSHPPRLFPLRNITRREGGLASSR